MQNSSPDRPSIVLDMQSPMTATAAAEAPPRRLRLWPGLVVVLFMWLAIVIPAWVAPLTKAQFYGWFMGPIAATALLFAWWLFASRIRWADRWLGLLAFVAGGAAAWFLGHRSIRGFGTVVYALPVALTAWVLWLAITAGLRWPVRRTGLIAVLLLAWGGFLLVRSEGTDGSIRATFRPRWTTTAEERFLANLAAGKIGNASTRGAPTTAPTTGPVALGPGDWPGFRGPERDGRLTGVRIATDWDRRPPKQVWRHPVGPGWGSFAVVGDRVYTQEQRGPDEMVVCYDAGSGIEVWAHRDANRFDEPMAGPGPRATPTFSEGQLYTLGASGRLNCLDAASGRVVWTRDMAADSGAKLPAWGFASSPLIWHDLVFVYAGGPGGKGVLAYRASSGEPAWSADAGTHSYCSVHPAKVGGVEQVVIATDRGLAAFEPAGGKPLWRYDWPLEPGMFRVVQPTLVPNPAGDSDVLVGSSFGAGTRRVHVGHDGERWTTQDLWTSPAIKPYFNDVIAHKGSLYGFDGSFLACVSLEDGKKQWKQRGYGNGQILLLADQDLLLVLSEKGEAALVQARPEAAKELARFQAIEGKTWNHPVIAHGKLFVRNCEEAACYELPAEEGTAVAGR